MKDILMKYEKQGEIILNEFIWMEPIKLYAQIDTPIDGLYLCHTANHPGGGVTGFKSRITPHQVLKDWK